MMKIKQRAKNKLANSPRFCALQCIYAVEYEQEYSNYVVNRVLKDNVLTQQDSRLFVQLVYGVIQRKLTLDAQLQPFVKQKKIELWVQSLLRLSVYQIVYLDRIPDHAVVNEAVEIAKLNGHEGIGKMVNAILRNVLRQKENNLPLEEDTIDQLEIAYSMPKWLIHKLLEWLEGDLVRLKQLLESLVQEPFLSVRIVGALHQKQEIINQLLQEGVHVEESPLSEYGLRIVSGDVFSTTVFQQGKLTVQDESSMLVVPLGHLDGKEQVLDACAAPGGKATHIAQLLTSGHLTALDISAKKLHTVQEHLQRMGLQEKVSLFVSDASKYMPKNLVLYDTIYIDAPCSGLGLMRRKPEIKYQKKAEDITALSHIQNSILEHVSSLLKPGGTLVYSTCTLSPQENQQVIQHFLAANPTFKIDPIVADGKLQSSSITTEGFVQIWPDQYQTDGFFIARLKKHNSVR